TLTTIWESPDSSFRRDALDAARVRRVTKNFSYHGARGRVEIRPEGTSMKTYLMRSTGLDYELVEIFPAR
ncbi:hypothetical protein, partial [Ruegeria sp. HKCCD8929]|uniref:hypothetical protein n=1 Tax=Ruegeria sp. HKCCD8929 TaxID=2683006 RepID=UPI001C2C73F1